MNELDEDNHEMDKDDEEDGQYSFSIPTIPSFNSAPPRMYNEAAERAKATATVVHVQVQKGTFPGEIGYL